LGDLWGYFEKNNDDFNPFPLLWPQNPPWRRLVNWIFLGFFPGGYTGETLGGAKSFPPKMGLDLDTFHSVGHWLLIG